MRVLSGGCAYGGLRVRDSSETWIPSQVDRNKGQTVSPPLAGFSRTLAVAGGGPPARSCEGRRLGTAGRETAAPRLGPSHVWSRWLGSVSAQWHVLPGTLGGPLLSWWPTPHGGRTWRVASAFCQGAGWNTALLTAPNQAQRCSCGRGNSGRHQHLKQVKQKMSRCVPDDEG